MFARENCSRWRGGKSMAQAAVDFFSADKLPQVQNMERPPGAFRLFGHPQPMKFPWSPWWESFAALLCETWRKFSFVIHRGEGPLPRCITQTFRKSRPVRHPFSIAVNIGGRNGGACVL